MADSRNRLAHLADPLTKREQEILAGLVEGLSDQEIAQRLYLAVKTVKWYNSQIYSKLGVANRKEAVEQAAVLGLLSASDAGTGTPEARHNLPVQTTAFIGRQQELVELARLIASPETRLVTILAPGGMGKTRLSLAAAEGQLRRFADGVFFVPLAPLSAPDDIVTTIAESVGFSFFGSEPPQKQLLNYLHDRHLLLVLDNFEHLLDGAPLVTAILQAAPQVKVLVTSREKLNLSGETVYTLAGLHFPDWETPADALAYDAVKLFMQSAHHIRPDFELQADDLVYLARICRLTAGMPLGIVLAAGWLDVLALAQISAEIQKGIDILETEQRDVPERQRSVRATFQYSWARLSEAEQDGFTKLSVFRGGFTTEAAEAVAGADVRALRRLASKALVQVLPSGRYEVHELLRQYGEEKLRQTEAAEAVSQAHSTYYLSFMAARDADIKGRRQQAGLQEIRADFENIRQGWLWAVERRQYDAINWAILDCLVNFAEMAFSYPEAQALLGQAVTALRPLAGEPPQPIWDQAVVRLERVNYYMLVIPTDDAQLEAILARARARGDEREMAYCLWVLGDWAADARHDYAAFRAYYEECLALWQSVGDAFYIAHTFVGLGMRSIWGEVERGREGLRQSVSIRRELGDRSNLGWSLYVLSWYSILFDDFDEAEALLDEALALQAQIGHASVYIHLLTQKAQLAFWRGELESAMRYLQTAQAFAGERVYVNGRSIMLAVLSAVASVGGHYARGYALGQQANAALPAYLQGEAALCQWELALAHCGLGNQAAARHALRQTLNSTAEDPELSIDQQLCLPLAAVLTARAGQPEHAVELLGLAYRAPKELTGWTEQWQLLVDLRRDLEAALGAAVYAAAWERGAKRDLETVVEQLLAELAQ